MRKAGKVLGAIKVDYRALLIPLDSFSPHGAIFSVFLSVKTSHKCLRIGSE
jgi:hypothetical protein